MNDDQQFLAVVRIGRAKCLDFYDVVSAYMWAGDNQLNGYTFSYDGIFIFEPLIIGRNA
jgi:hypothetical protein